MLEIEATRKKNRNKNVERRLCVLIMYAEGKTLEDIAEKTSYHVSTAGKLISRYMRNGISAIVENHYQGNRRNMSFEEEAAILVPFIERAAGLLVYGEHRSREKRHNKRKTHTRGIL